MSITLKDVARVAGTSVASVSATLHGTRGETIRVSEATRLKIRTAAASLGYVANPIAKSLATGKTRILGLMLPYADAFLDQNPFCNQVMHGVMKEVVLRHYNLMLYTATGGLNSEQAVRFIDSRVDGALIVMPPADSRIAHHCERRGIPHVSILSQPTEGAWSVNSDDFTGGKLAAEHLISLGHKQIAHLAGSPGVASTAPRRRGFKSALSAAGFSLLDCPVEPAGFDPNSGFEAMNRILDRPRQERPTAIFAANDLCAEGAMRAVRARGLNVPSDIAVVGYDDTWFATMTQPQLTSVRMPISEMGAKAVALLVDRLEGREVVETQLVLPVDLTIRHSCGALPLSHSLGTEQSPISLQ